MTRSNPQMQASKLEGTMKSEKGIEEVLSFIRAWDFGREPLKFKVFGAGQTLDYKAVFWIWMRSFAKQFNERNRPTDKDGEELHEIFCYQFLGMAPEKKLKNGKVIPPRLRTITTPKNLDKGQWFDFLRQIEEQACNWGLTIPEYSSEYSEAKAKANS